MTKEPCNSLECICLSLLKLNALAFSYGDQRVIQLSWVHLPSSTLATSWEKGHSTLLNVPIITYLNWMPLHSHLETKVPCNSLKCICCHLLKSNALAFKPHDERALQLSWVHLLLKSGALAFAPANHKAMKFSWVHLALFTYGKFPCICMWRPNGDALAFAPSNQQGHANLWSAFGIIDLSQMPLHSHLATKGLATLLSAFAHAYLSRMPLHSHLVTKEPVTHLSAPCIHT